MSESSSEVRRFIRLLGLIDYRLFKLKLSISDVVPPDSIILEYEPAGRDGTNIDESADSGECLSMYFEVATHKSLAHRNHILCLHFDIWWWNSQWEVTSTIDWGGGGGQRQDIIERTVSSDSIGGLSDELTLITDDMIEIFEKILRAHLHESPSTHISK